MVADEGQIPEVRLSNAEREAVIGGTANETNVAGDSPMVVRVRSYGTMGGCTVRNLSKRERKKRGLPRT